MPIKLNGATSGSVELGVPDVVGSDVQNVLLPSTAGTLDRLERAGNILQVVQDIKSDTESFSVATLSDSSAILQQSITISASSKVLVMATLHMSCTTTFAGFTFKRDGTSIGISDVSGVRSRVTGLTYNNTTPYSIIPANCMFLDSPGSAGTYTYSVTGRHSSSATQTIHVNRTADFQNLAKFMNTVSHLTLMEVAG